MPAEDEQSEKLRFASLVAHQLRAPVAAVRSLLSALADGHGGPLTDRQKDALRRAIARCDQASESSRRMLAIAAAGQGGFATDEVTDLAPLVRQAQANVQGPADQRGLRLSVRVDVDAAPVRLQRAALEEALGALLDNALKYTPDRGDVRLALTPGPERNTVRLAVSDSGVGIAPEHRRKVFDAFYRTGTMRQSSRPGAGLGLALVKTMAEAAGGQVSAGQAEQLGGAEIALTLPLAEPAETPAPTEGADRLRVVIVGGVAAGPKAAAKVIRMCPDAEVTVIEQGEFLSYAGCGLPYYLAGDVRDQKELMSSSLGGVRDPVFFQNVKNVRTLSRTVAEAIDRPGKRVRIRDVQSGRERWLEYDKLVLATGASPVVPEIPGRELGNVFTLHGVRDAEGIRSVLSRLQAHDVVIVGGGLLGVTATEALVRRGGRVTILELQPQILNILDADIARLVERHLHSHGVKVLTGTRVERFEGGDEGRVRAVVADRGAFAADAVILGIGVRPNVELARRAGLELGVTGAIQVDERMATSDPDIYAAGDCCQSVDRLTGRPCYVPMGSTAHKQARVAAINLCGGRDTFPGVLGTTICKVFDYCVARTGLTEAQARALGYDVVTVLAPAPDRAHYMPDARELLLKLVADRKTRRLLGAQATGPGQADKRIDVAAMALTAGLTVDELAQADLAYAPPYAPAMDNIITAANVARNKLDGRMTGIGPAEVHRKLQAGEDFLFLDCRTPAEYEALRLPGSTLVPLGALRGRLSELPRDKEIITFCDISLRGYEAQIILRAAGFENVKVMDGGVAMWPFEKIHG